MIFYFFRKKTRTRLEFKLKRHLDVVLKRRELKKNVSATLVGGPRRFDEDGTTGTGVPDGLTSVKSFKKAYEKSKFVKLIILCFFF